MIITMIKPNIGMLQQKKGADIPFNDDGRMEPLQLGILAGLTPKEFDVRLVDDRIEKVNYDAPTELVAITVEIYMAKRAYEIAGEFRKRKVPVILGGIHASMLPEEAGQFADALIIGDAEAVWEKVLDDFKNGSLKKEYQSFPSNPHPGKIACRDVYKGKKYLPITLLQYGRGCPFGCNFCSISKYFNKQVFYRGVDEVIGEIKQQNRKLLFFVDDNIVSDMDRAKELFKALVPLKIKWVGQASLTMTEDAELMDLMQKSGCLGLVVGFEAATAKGLNALNKNHNSNTNYEEQIKIIRKHRIHIWAAFLLGHDEETLETLDETLKFAISQRFTFAAYNILMPYPKTEVYDGLKEEGRLLYDEKWWLHPDYRFNYAAFKPKHMSADDLTKKCFYMRKKYNSLPVLLKRLFAWHNLRNVGRLGFLFKVMVLFRVETLKKQGMKFGFEE